MEHDIIAFIEKNHAVIIAGIITVFAWFKKEICRIVPAIWEFLGSYNGCQGVWLYIKTGQKQKKEIQNETPLH